MPPFPKPTTIDHKPTQEAPRELERFIPMPVPVTKDVPEADFDNFEFPNDVDHLLADMVPSFEEV